MGKAKKDRIKSPIKKQKSLFDFKGFSKKNSTGKILEQPKIRDSCVCEFCGELLAHAGACKMHEFWCKQKSTGTFLSEFLNDFILKFTMTAGFTNGQILNFSIFL